MYLALLVSLAASLAASLVQCAAHDDASSKDASNHASAAPPAAAHASTPASTRVPTPAAVRTAPRRGAHDTRADTDYTVTISIPRRAAAAQPDSGSHEPPMMHRINDWDGHGQGAWKTADGKPMRQTFAYDAELSDTVMVQQYGPWHVPDRQTWGPGHLYFPIPAASRPLTSFYLRAQIKLSPNWQQPPGVGDQKLFQMMPSTGHGYNVGTILLGGNGRIRFTAYENNSVDPRYNGIPLGQNPRGGAFVPPPRDAFTLDTWHTIEVLVIGSTLGLQNGRVSTWLDGKPQIDVRDMMWVAGDQDSNFSQFDLNSLWGGQGGSLDSPQFMYIGKIHLSGTSEHILDRTP